MKLHGTQIIASASSGKGTDGFSAVNPVDGVELEPIFCEATQDDVEGAVRQAAAACDAYRALTLGQRASFLENIGAELMSLGESLVDRAHQETALPRQMLEAELGRTVNQLNLMAGGVRGGGFLDVRIDRGQPERLPTPKPDIRTMNVPLGPVAIFGASNFPLAFSVAGGDTASALAAGCPVVVKGHPAHPGTSELAGLAITRAIARSQVPEGVFSLLQGTGYAVGRHLVRHPLIRAVAFTGSLAGGRALFDLACSRPQPVPVYAEMGSVNPVFLLPGAVAADDGSLANGLAASMTMRAGQFCTAPGLVFMIQGDATGPFLERLVENLDAVPQESLVHRGIKENFLAGLHRLLSVDGVRQRRPLDEALEGCRVSPVLLQTSADVFRSAPELSEEVFGPAALVVLCRSVSEMLAAAESLPGQLTASVHGRVDELEGARVLLGVLEGKAGRLVWNGFPTGVEVCPSMHHGGPYPATTDGRSTSVGTEAVRRFLRPACYQNFPRELLAVPLRN